MSSKVIALRIELKLKNIFLDEIKKRMDINLNYFFCKFELLVFFCFVFIIMQYFEHFFFLNLIKVNFFIQSFCSLPKSKEKQSLYSLRVIFWFNVMLFFSIFDFDFFVFLTDNAVFHIQYPIVFLSMDLCIYLFAFHINYLSLSHSLSFSLFIVS